MACTVFQCYIENFFFVMLRTMTSYHALSIFCICIYVLVCKALIRYFATRQRTFGLNGEYRMTQLVAYLCRTKLTKHEGKAFSVSKDTITIYAYATGTSVWHYSSQKMTYAEQRTSLRCAGQLTGYGKGTVLTSPYISCNIGDSVMLTARKMFVLLSSII